MFIETFQENMHDRQIDKDLGKPVFSFVHRTNGFPCQQWFYTTELSRILLVGKHKVFKTIEYLPLVNILACVAPLFDNRFEDFIGHVGTSSQKRLQEAVKDVIVLSRYNTNAYSVGTLLDHLVEALEGKIVYTKDQIERGFKWDQKYVHYMQKSIALALGLTAVITTAEGYDELSYVRSIAALGLLPASYKMLKGCYKVLTTDPNASNKYLEKYEDLLVFVQKLKAQLEESGAIVFTLANGRIVTINEGGRFKRILDSAYDHIFSSKAEFCMLGGLGACLLLTIPQEQLQLSNKFGRW